MVDLVNYVEISRLLEEVAALEDRLTGNERELFRTLTARYAEPVDGTFDDKVCLEVMLRNVQIREGLGMKPGEASRRVDLPRSSDKGNGAGDGEG